MYLTNMVTIGSVDPYEFTTRAGFRSTITMTAYPDPSQPVISGGFIVMRNPEGVLVSFEDNGSTDRMVSDTSITTPRPGYEVFHIDRDGGNVGDSIGRGDTVILSVFSFSRGRTMFLTAGASAV